MQWDLKRIISDSLEQSFSAEEYQDLLTSYATEGKTSGDQKEDLIYFTKLNAQRAKRVGKTVEVEGALAEKIRSLPRQTWLLITETWCGDAANSVPVIAKMAELNPLIDLRIVLRDENLDLMDQFSDPRVDVPFRSSLRLDADLNVLFDWGPRPKDAQDLYWGWRERADREPYKEFQVVLQKWYNESNGCDVQDEMFKLFDLEIDHLKV